MAGFNIYKKTKRSFGGSHSVWRLIKQKYVSGGVVTERNLPSVGTYIAVGTPVGVDKAGGEATFLYAYEVVEAVTATSTVVKVKAGLGLPTPSNGEFLMKEPDTIEGEGKGIKVGTVTLNQTEGVHEIKITADSLGEIAAGELLVSADKAGEGATLACLPVGLLENDIYIEDGTHAALCTIVTHGAVFYDRIAKIPACVIKELKQAITFEKGV